MLKYDLDRARAAVEYLVKTPYYPHRVRGLRGNVKKPRALPYSGDEEVLNELLIIGRQNLQAMENLIAVAGFKRTQDRNSYQREYMAAMRARLRSAIQLEERRIGRKMTLDERNRYMHEVQRCWMEERDEYLVKRAEQFKVQWKEEPGHEDRKAFIEQFWTVKQQELDAMLQEPVKADHNLRKKKRVVTVSETESAISSAMRKAIEKRK